MGRQREDIDHEPAYGKIYTSEELGRIIRFKRKEIGVRQEVAAGMAGVGTKFLS
jgi:HTH-type transcriptional regulator / antitoxin HipB